MPKIPSLNNPTINPQALGGGELRLNVTPELVGGAKVRNLAALSGTLGEAAVLMDVQRQRRDGQSTMKFKKTLTQVEDQILETNDSLKGEKAFGFNSSVQGLAKTWFQPSEETSGSDEDVVADSEMLEKFGFDSATEQIQALKRIWHQMPEYLQEELAPGLKRRFSRLYQKLGRHEQIQSDRALIQDHQQDMQTSLERIRKNPLDGDFIEEQIEMMGLSVDHFANLVGWSEERQNREWQHVLGTVNLTVIDRLLKTGHAREAREYFAAHRKEFGETDTAPLEARIEQQYEVEAGEALANEIYSLPKDLQIRALTDEPNPNIRQAAQRFMAYKDREETLKKLETQYENSVYIRQLIDKGETPVPLPEITKLDQWLALDSKTQELLIQRWEDRAGYRFGEESSPEGQFKLTVDDGSFSPIASREPSEEDLTGGLIDLNRSKGWVDLLKGAVSLNSNHPLGFERLANKDFQAEARGISPSIVTYFSRFEKAASDLYNAQKLSKTEEVPDIDELRAVYEKEKDEVSTILQQLQSEEIEADYQDFYVFAVIEEVMKKEKELGRRLTAEEIADIGAKANTPQREILWDRSILAAQTPDPRNRPSASSSSFSSGPGIVVPLNTSPNEGSPLLNLEKFKALRQKEDIDINDKSLNNVVSAYNKDIRKFKMFHPGAMTPDLENALIRGRMKDKLHYRGKRISADDLEGKDPKEIYVLVGLPTALHDPTKKDEDALKFYEITLDQLIGLPQSTFDIIGKILRETGTDPGWTKVAEILVNLRRPGSHKNAQANHDLIFKNLIEPGFNNEEVRKNFHKGFNKKMLADKESIQNPKVALASGKISKTELVRLNATDLRQIWKDNRQLAMDYQIGDYMLYAPGVKPENVTRVLERVDAEFSLEELEKNKEDMVKKFNKKIQPHMERLIDALIRRKRKEQQEIQPGPIAEATPLDFSTEKARQASVLQIAERFKDTVSMSTDQMAQVTNIMVKNEFPTDPKKKKEERRIGPMGITRATAKLIAKNSDLGFRAEDILKDPEKNIQAGMWLLFEKIMPQFEDTDKPFLFALATYVSEINTIKKAQAKAIIDNKGHNAEIRFVDVVKYLPEEVMVFVRKFYPVLTEQNLPKTRNDNP